MNIAALFLCVLWISVGYFFATVLSNHFGAAGWIAGLLIGVISFWILVIRRLAPKEESTDEKDILAIRIFEGATTSASLFSGLIVGMFLSTRANPEYRIYAWFVGAYIGVCGFYVLLSLLWKFFDAIKQRCNRHRS